MASVMKVATKVALMCALGGINNTLADTLDDAAAGPLKRYAQFMIGDMSLKDSWRLYDDAGNEYQAVIDGLHMFSFTLQEPRNFGRWQYGFEGGVSLGYDNERKLFVLVHGNGVGISIDSTLWTGDFSAGAFLSVKPTRWLRAYAAVGPSLYWGRFDADDNGAENDVNATNSSVIDSDVIIDTRDNDYDLGVAVYGRLGLDIIFNNGFVLGVSVRQSSATLDFDANGEVDLNQPQYVINLGHYF